MEGSFAPLLAFEKRPYITKCPVLFFLYPLFQKKIICIASFVILLY